jgi:hypothetical protein
MSRPKCIVRMVFHTRRLHHLDDMPLAMCKTRKGKNLYITIDKMAELPRGAVKRICPGISLEESNSIQPTL